MVPVPLLFVLFSFPVYARDFLDSHSDLVPGDSRAVQVAEAARSHLVEALSTISLRRQLEADGLSSTFLDKFVLDPGNAQGLQFWVLKPNIASSFLQSGTMRMIDENQSVTNSSTDSAIRELAQIGAGDNRTASLHLEQQLSAFVERISREFLTNTKAAFQQQTQDLNQGFSEQIQGVVKELHQQTELLKAQAAPHHNSKPCGIVVHPRMASNTDSYIKRESHIKNTFSKNGLPVDCPAGELQGLTYIPNAGMTAIQKGAYAYICCDGK